MGTVVDDVEVVNGASLPTLSGSTFTLYGYNGSGNTVKIPQASVASFVASELEAANKLFAVNGASIEISEGNLILPVSCSNGTVNFADGEVTAITVPPEMEDCEYRVVFSVGSETPAEIESEHSGSVYTDNTTLTKGTYIMNVLCVSDSVFLTFTEIKALE